MVAPDSGRQVLLVLGLARRIRWPEPLEGVVGKWWEVGMEPVATMFEAAGRMAEAGNGEGVAGLLLDPCVVMLRDLEAARVMGRYMRAADRDAAAGGGGRDAGEGGGEVWGARVGGAPRCWRGCWRSGIDPMLCRPI